MWPSRSYPIIGLLAALLLMAGCATGPSDEARAGAAERVLAVYEVPGLMTQAGPAIAQSLERNLPAGVDTAARDRLGNGLREVYQPERLAAGVEQRLATAAAREDEGAALVEAADTLDAPLVRRMIDLESAQADQQFVEGFQAFADQPMDASREQRLATIESLVADMRVVDLQTRFNTTLLESMIRVRNPVVPAAEQVSEAQIEQTVAQTRSDIESRLQERVPLMLLYVFRDVSDADLQRYAELQSAPAMTWTNAAVESAIIDTLDDAGLRLVDRVTTGAGQP